MMHVSGRKSENIQRMNHRLQGRCGWFWWIWYVKLGLWRLLK